MSKDWGHIIENMKYFKEEDGILFCKYVKCATKCYQT